MATPNIIIFVGISILLAATLTKQINGIQFSYSGATGPDTWGSLSPSFKACSTGKSQSPVNIVKKDVIFNSKLKTLKRDYRPTNATLINNGFNIGLLYANEVGVVNMDGKNYTLKQMHWHSPAEHTIDGVRHPLELHLLHMAADGSISVVAILYRYGDPDPLILEIKNNLDELVKEVHEGQEGAHVPVKLMKTKYLKHSSRKYFRYVGSLTVPPCTENVMWTILIKVRHISKEQISILKAPLYSTCKNNSRPLMSLNGRHVELYDEQRSHLAGAIQLNMT